MKYDLVVDYDELTKDKVVNILIENVQSSDAQIWVVNTALVILNLLSPVKFNVMMQLK